MQKPPSVRPAKAGTRSHPPTPLPLVIDQVAVVQVLLKDGLVLRQAEFPRNFPQARCGDVAAVVYEKKSENCWQNRPRDSMAPCVLCLVFYRSRLSYRDYTTVKGPKRHKTACFWHFHLIHCVKLCIFYQGGKDERSWSGDKGT